MNVIFPDCADQAGANAIFPCVCGTTGLCDRATETCDGGTSTCASPLCDASPMPTNQPCICGGVGGPECAPTGVNGCTSLSAGGICAKRLRGEIDNHD